MNKHEGTEQQAGGGGQQDSVGAMLRQLRKEKNISIRDVSEATNLSTSNLVAIEHEQYAELPSSTFVRGQVAIYGNFLGIDGADAARKFMAERERQERGNQKNFGREKSGGMSAKQLAEPAHLSAATLAAGVLLLIFLFIAGFSLYTGWNPISFLQPPQKQQPDAGSAEIQQHIPADN